MEQPTPRLALGAALRGLATAAIDISDGLVGDLAHILKASGTGACIDQAIAMNLIAAKHHPAWTRAGISPEMQLELVLAGGDDYELAFTAPPAAREAVQATAARAGTPVTRMGQIEAAPGLRLRSADGSVRENRLAAFDHFR